MTIPFSGTCISNRPLAVGPISSADSALRADTMAAIRAAKDVWLASPDEWDAETRSRNIDALVDMLVDQTASAAHRR